MPPHSKRFDISVKFGMSCQRTSASTWLVRPRRPTGGEDITNTGSPGDTEAEDGIVVRAGDGVRVVTLNRPAVRNAMTATMARTYAAALRAADDDPAVRDVVDGDRCQAMS